MFNTSTWDSPGSAVSLLTAQKLREVRFCWPNQRNGKGQPIIGKLKPGRPRIFTVGLLWILFIPRINLSPFTKDFRGEDQHNESIDQFLWSYHQIGRLSLIRNLNKLPCATPAQSSTPNVLCFRFASPTPFYADILPDFNKLFQRLFGQTCNLSCQHRQYSVNVSPRRCMSNLVTIGPVVLEKHTFCEIGTKLEPYRED